MPLSDANDYLNGEQIKHSNLSRFIIGIGQPIGLITMLLGLLVLVGYAFNLEYLYRPIVNGPATNPLTATIVVLVALSIEMSNRVISKKMPVLLGLVATVLCTLYIVEGASGIPFTTTLVPFQSIVDRDLLLGKSNSVGVNTAFMLLLLALSHLSYIFKFPLISQLLSFTALCFPLISITGYAYGLTAFYGSMSLLSTTLGVLLCIGTLAVTADKGGLRALLSPYIGGKIARIQILLGYFVPLLIGYMVIRSLVNSSQNSIFGIYVVSICWFIALLVVVSAIMQEKVDSKRREMEQMLHHSAMTDELTQLPNRRFFMEMAAQKLEEDRELVAPLTSWLLMIDIDHFKKVNDTAGHEMGDKILIEFARILNKFVREEDLICRLGGEEFSLYLSEMTKEEASIVADSIRRAVEEIVVPDYTEKHGHITTSIGCAHVSDKEGVDHALRLADSALYLSKSSGRNRVTFS
ncbi:GGDEF domain-containing protein [Marinomonas flavescens]|uniref:GGDEF domain-containing protein n=1 Tax=Marinomonas flavescens TaxID=2529379 RepID=UPI0010550634|nr:GGDEF domain-containing protein [Marinomonas flavescens]